MPKLKQITCSIEIGHSRTRLTEYGARYSDGSVESFIAVPETQVPFCIRVQSNGYIAPGLAAFVFMDGQYQCNRNKLKLNIPTDNMPTNQYEVDFCLRQKEEKTASGTFVGRDWSFAQLDTSTADNAATLNPKFIQNVGTIEVVILRCKSEGEQVPTPVLAPQALFSKFAKDDVRPRAPSVAQSVRRRTVTPAPSEPFGGMGGMMGIFDGANDERPPSISSQEPVWCSFEGAEIPRFAVGETDVGKHDARLGRPVQEPRALPFAVNRDDRSQIHGKGKQNPQVDGENGVNVFIGQNAIPGRDDMRGDVYFGARGPARDQAKVRYREQGVDRTDSTPPHGHRKDVKHGYRHGADPNTRQTPKHRSHQPANTLQDDVGEYVPGAQGNRIYVKLHPSLLQHQPALQLQPTQHPIHQAAAQLPPQFAPSYAPQPLPQSAPQFAHQLAPELVAQFQKIQPERVPSILNDLLEKVEQIERQKEECSHQAEAAMAGPVTAILVRHLDSLKREGERIFGHYSDLRQFYEEFCQQYGYKNAMPEMDRNRAQAKAMAQTHEPAAANDWVPAGEAVVGGGAPLNQAWQAQPSAQKLSGNANGQTSHSKQNSKGGDGANGWDNNAQGNTQWDTGAQQVNNQWADNNGQKSATKKSASQGGWANGTLQNNNEWENTKSHSNKSKTASHAGEGSKGNQQAGAGWGTSNSNKDAGAQGGWGDNDGGGDGGGWGGNDQQKDSASGKGNDQDWGNTGGGSKKAPSVALSHSQKWDTNSVSSSAPPQVKSYWADWRHTSAPHESSDPNTKKKREIVARDAYDFPAAPLPAMPADQARGATYGVQTGKGADYSHRCHRPNYLDTMAQPYAVFSFKYRSKAALEKITKRNITADIEPILAQVEQDKLMSMPRSMLIEELMKARTPARGTPSKSGSVRGASGGNDGWNSGSQKSGSKKDGSQAGGWGNNDQGGKSQSGGNNDNWGTKSRRSASKNDGGWGGDNQGGKSQSGGNNNNEWANTGQKSASKKDGGWETSNKENSGNAWGAPEAGNNGGGGWATPTPAGNGGGWDGGNDAKPASVKAGSGPQQWGPDATAQLQARIMASGLASMPQHDMLREYKKPAGVPVAEVITGAYDDGGKPASMATGFTAESQRMGPEDRKLMNIPHYAGRGAMNTPSKEPAAHNFQGFQATPTFQREMRNVQPPPAYVPMANFGGAGLGGLPPVVAYRAPNQAYVEEAVGHEAGGGDRPMGGPVHPMARYENGGGGLGGGPSNW